MSSERFDWYAIKLVLVCIAVFALQNLWPPLTGMFVLVSSDALVRPWLLLTSMFLHGSVTHLIYNMLALALFGSILEKTVGSRKFLLAYFSGGIVAGIGSTFFYSASLGASGAIFAVQGYLAALRPRMMIWAYSVPMPMFVAVIVWTVTNFLGIFFPTDIAYASHLFGLAFGITAGLYYRQPEKKQPKEKILSEEEIDMWEEEYMMH